MIPDWEVNRVYFSDLLAKEGGVLNCVSWGAKVTDDSATDHLPRNA